MIVKWKAIKRKRISKSRESLEEGFNESCKDPMGIRRMREIEKDKDCRVWNTKRMKIHRRCVPFG